MWLLNLRKKKSFNPPYVCSTLSKIKDAVQRGFYWVLFKYGRGFFFENFALMLMVVEVYSYQIKEIMISFLHLVHID